MSADRSPLPRQSSAAGAREAPAPAGPLRDSPAATGSFIGTSAGLPTVGAAPTPAGLRTRLAATLDVRAEERAPLLAAAGWQFAFVAGVAVLKTGSNTLLVHRMEDARVLPVLYIASALVTAGAAALAALRPRTRWPPAGALAGWVSLLALSAAASAHLGAPALAALYLAAEAGTTLLSVRFWSVLGDTFDVRASRRLLGLVGGAGMAGCVAGGAAAHFVGANAGAVWLIPLGCLLLVGALVPAARLRAPRQARRPRPAVDVRAFVRAEALPLSLAALVTLLAVLSVAADFVFRIRARAALDEAGLASLFSGLSMLVGTAAMVLHLGVATPLLRRFGLFAFVALGPAACLGFAAAGFFRDALWPAYGLKAAQEIASMSLLQTGLALLYGPMPEGVRAAVRALVDGLARKAGYALGGTALLVLAAQAQGSLPVLLAGGAALGALVVLARVRADYVRSVGARLQSPQADGTPDLADASSRAALERALGDSDEGKVLAALELLARDADALRGARLRALLDHASAAVRATAARLAAARGAGECAERLTELALSDVASVREPAIAAVARLRPYTAARLLAPLLDDADQAVRAAAVAALLPLDPLGPAGRALERLVSGASSAEQRARVARLLGTLGPGAHARRLQAHLADEDPQVRRAACVAAGESREPSLVAQLLVLLQARETRREAREALVRHGDDVADALDAALNDRSAPARLRYHLPRVLRELGTARALQVILFSNTEDDPFLMYRLCVAAGRLHEEHPDVDVDRERALAALNRRLDAYEEMLPAADDLCAALGPANLLVRATHDRLDQHLEGAVRLAGLVFPCRPVLNAYNRFVHGDESTRPFAIEMLEHTIDDPVARRLTRLLERWHRRPDRPGRPERAPARLQELVQAADPVLRAIATATVHQLAALRRGRGTGTVPESPGLHTLARLARGPHWEALLAAPPAIREEGPVSESIVEKILFLEGVDIFEESDVDDLAAVARCVRERTFAAGEMIYQQNDPGDAMYVVVEGRVRVEKEGRTVVEMGPRDSFGETSLLDHRPRPATARALTPLRVLVLERADFMDLVSDRVELLRGIFSAITKHLRNLLDASAAGRITSPSLTPVALPRTRGRPA